MFAPTQKKQCYCKKNMTPHQKKYVGSSQKKKLDSLLKKFTTKKTKTFGPPHNFLGLLQFFLDRKKRRKKSCI